MSGLTDDVKKQLAVFNAAISSLEELLEQNLGSFDEHLRRDAFEMLKMDNAALFTVNALTTAIVATTGRNPKDNEELQNEMQRVKSLMVRTKEQEDRRNLAPEINQRASKAFVRNALFDVDESTQRIQEKRAAEAAAAEAEEAPPKIPKMTD
ncbi:unnamed protein product, partial [Mesorhabditis spiculigera]